jgi:hypothetical protein
MEYVLPLLRISPQLFKEEHLSPYQQKTSCVSFTFILTSAIMWLQKHTSTQQNGQSFWTNKHTTNV